MSHSEYCMTKTIHASFESVIDKLKSELAKEDYGVFAEVDVQSVLASELGVNLPKTRIIGTNRPEVGYALLTADPSIGVVLPFSIIVHERLGSTGEVAAVDPVVLLQSIDHPVAHEIAPQVRNALTAAMERL